MATSPPPFALLSVAANLERHKLASDEPFLLLLDLQYPGPSGARGTTSGPGPGVAQSHLQYPAGGGAALDQAHIRFVRNLDAVTFDSGDGNGPQVYSPFNFEIGDLMVGTTGSFPELELKVSNILRALQSTIEAYGGLVASYLTLYVLNTANPTGESELTMSFTIKQTTCDAKLVSFKLGASSPLRRLFPLFMYRPNQCGWQYKGPECGYTGDIPTCSHTIDGATGCKAHFLTSPLRGLFFPGIDSNGAAVAGVA